MDKTVSAVRRENAALDIAKFAAAILICASHCLPIFGNAELDYYYGQWFFRFCVPLFLISSGYFFTHMEPKRQIRYCIRIAAVYAVSVLFYVVTGLLAGVSYLMSGVLNEILFGYGHLWYLPALFLACVLWSVLSRIVNRKVIYTAAIILFAFGIFFDEYYKLFGSASLNAAASFIDGNLGQTRNGIFFAFPMICLGAFTRDTLLPRVSRLRKKAPVLLAGFLVSFALFFAESTVFHKTLPADVIISFDLSVFNWLPALFLFLISMTSEVAMPAAFARLLRKGADVVYIVHYAVIVVAGECFYRWGMDAFIISAIVSIVIAAVYVLLRSLVLSLKKKTA